MNQMRVFLRVLTPVAAMVIAAGLHAQTLDSLSFDKKLKLAKVGDEDAQVAVAQNNLGLMYLNGKGVARDYGKAFALFEQAAKQGDAWGINNLGGLYEMGWGVKQDRQKALAYYKQASEKGNKRAGDNMKRLAAALGPSEAAASALKPEP